MEQPVSKESYPIRPGKQDCAFYMQKGHCKFKDKCKFNHPPIGTGPTVALRKNSGESKVSSQTTPSISRKASAADNGARIVTAGKIARGECIRGKVIKVVSDKRIGFVQYDADYEVLEEIFFHYDRLKFGLLEPAPGDKVLFTLMDPADSKKGPAAREVRPIQLTRRPAEIVRKYVQLIRDRAHSSEHAELREASFDIASCKPVWALLLNTDLSPSDARGIIEFVLALSSKRGFQMHFSTFMQCFRGTLFLKPKKALHHLVLTEPELTDRFIFCALRSSKSVAGNLLTLLSTLSDEANRLYPESALCHLVNRHLLGITRLVTAGELDVSDLPWYDVPLVPRVTEVFSETAHGIANLKPVKVVGAYDSRDEYLDTYFRLLRFDCFAEFNAGIKSFLDGTLDSRSNLLTYHSMSLKGIQLIENNCGIGLVIQFQLDKNPKDWKSAPHLRFGNLVCLSPSGGFKDPLWAVVADRDIERLRKDQTTYLELCSTEYNSMSDAEAILALLESKKTVMVESPTYYRAFEPVMRAMQVFSESEELPFSKMLVDVDFSENTYAVDVFGMESEVDASQIFKLDKIAGSSLFRTASSFSTCSTTNSQDSLLKTVHLPNKSLPGSDLQWRSSTQCETVSNSVKKYVIKDPGSSHSKELAEYNMAYAQFSRLVSRGPPSIKQIDVYENKVLEEKYSSEHARMVRDRIDPAETWVFHGTQTESNIEAIMVGGFKVGGQDGIPIAHGAAHGSGVYSATSPDTPMAYGSRVKKVILALALRGHSGTNRQDCDSWTPRSDWIIFRSGGQLLPRYVVHYTDCEVSEQSVLVGNPLLLGGRAKIRSVLHWISILEESTDCELAKFSDLDRGQLKSIQVALQNRVSIIQGPPGTGKTFIGVKIVQLLLSSSTYPSNTPILLLTYKNHALDEFLVDCIGKLGHEAVIRVGGRSSEKMLESRNLSIVRRDTPKEKYLFEALNKARKDVEDCKLNVKSKALELRKTFELPTADDFLDQAYEPQIEHMMMACDWSREVLTQRATKIEFSDILACLAKLKVIEREEGLEYPEVKGFQSLSEVLQGELEGELEDIQTRLRDYLQRALDLWYPNKSEFEAMRPIRVPPPPLLFERIKWDSIENIFDIAEVDIIDEEPERLATEQAQKWNPDDYVDLNVGRNKVYDDIDISSICSELVASSLRQHTALWELNSRQRACLTCIWMQNLRQQRITKLNQALQAFYEAKKALREIYDSHDADILRRAKVVGMTITGAALRSGLVGQVKPAVIIIEEAAEVLESQVLACLGPWVKRLVMIGDHKQLRPQVNCYELVKRCNFDVSMFERLIKNGIQHGILNTQNRMRPEFVAMLEQIYPTLHSNHARVNANQAPMCVSKSMYFWSHSDPETPGQSLSNVEECNRVVALALFFVQQGYSPSKITVLAAYRGQMRLLREAFKNMLHTVWEPPPSEPGKRIVYVKERQYREEDLLKMTDNELRLMMKEKGLRFEAKMSAQDIISQLLKSGTEYSTKVEVAVHTIDQFQGDENDIIIVSLVRSNNSGNIGFLSAVNRYCVAVSRARCGVYFVGNSSTLSAKSDHWQFLCNVMKMGSQAGIGESITLHCPRHPTTQIHAKTAEDIDLKNGICKVRCKALMPCGQHSCGKPCHAGDEQHKLCMHRILFKSICGHMNERRCFQLEADIVCKMPCKIPLPCGHPCPHRCGQTCAEECNICLKEIQERQEQEEKEIDRKLSDLLSKSKLREIGLYPSYWRPTCSPTKKFQVIDVTEKLQDPIQKLIDETCRRGALGRGVDQRQQGSYHSLKVHKVERVENPSLWRRYRLRYTELLEDKRRGCGTRTKTELEIVHVLSRPGKGWKPAANLDRDVREHFLFHGTTSFDTALQIAADGFEERLANLGGLYGAGAYFAEQSNKSDQYTKADEKGLHCMFMARVMLGAHVMDAVKPMNDLRILPHVPGARKDEGSEASSASSNGLRYSSLLGLYGAHREFVVYDRGQAYPEYLIHYRRV